MLIGLSAPAQAALDGFNDVASWPACFGNHLLVPRSSNVGRLKEYFQSLPDATRGFFCEPQTWETHIFTDGSCWADSSNSLYHTAAWATIDATTGNVIGAAPLHGLPQTIGRAELVAIIAGLEWCSLHMAVAQFWPDSLFVARGLAKFIALRAIPVHWEHYDLWQRVLDLLDLVSVATEQVHWILSHLDPLLCENPFESWVAHWNDVADRIAVQTNLPRSSSFWKVLSEAQEADERWTALRSFYFKVADLKKTEQFCTSHIYF